MKSTLNKLALSSLTATALVYGGGDIAPVEIPTVEIPVVAPSSFYGGIALSSMKLLNSDTDETFTAIGATLQLGYQYNDYIALEARYTQSASKVEYDNGTTSLIADNDDYPTDFTNLAIYLKPSYTMGDIGVYALLGYGEVALTNIPVGDVTRGEAGFQWGVGVSYALSETFGLFADYTSLYSGDGFDYLATANSHEATLTNVGVSYRF
jgi:opacity protein-like surface antigen